MSTEPHNASAIYFDGDVPIGRPATLRMERRTLHIDLGNGRCVLWPADDVRQQPDTSGREDAVLRAIGDPLARLHVSEPAVLTQFWQLNRPSPPKGRARLSIWAIAAVAAVGLQIGVLIPLLADNLARFIPPAGERALGEATFGHIRAALAGSGLPPVPVCDGSEGRAALKGLAQALTPAEISVETFVLDHKMVNAFALPGGYVVLFRGLLDAANDPDEVAAVLAHEIGHVASRDPTRHALRSAGSIGVLGLIFGDFAGGAAVLFLAERLISAQYSQQAEARADAYAHDRLKAAGITPAALGSMFRTMRDQHGDASSVTAHFLSHPLLGARIDAAEAAVEPEAAYGPSLTSGEWAALQEICR